MTFTYTLTTDIGKVRLRIGDHDSTDVLLTDEEIQVALDDQGSVVYAAALACEWIAGVFARKADKTVGPLSITLHQKYDQYMKLAATLRLQGAMSAVPHAGGISIAEKQSAEQDTDRVPPSFAVDGMDSDMVSTFNPNPNGLST